MNNADMPAMPHEFTFDTCEGTEHEMFSGLTKREHFAGLAMQGILANSNYEAPRCKKLSGMAIDAVAAADFLLKELDK